MIAIGSVAAACNSLGVLSLAIKKVVTHLGAAFDFSIFASGGNTVAGASTANWMCGGLTPAVSGTPVGSVQHYGDALATTVAADVQAAYVYYTGLTPAGSIYLGAAPVATSPTFSGDIAGLIFRPGVYFAAAAITNSSNVNFDAQGNPDATFVMLIGAAFAPAAASTVTLLNGAQSANIFWCCTGAVAAGATAAMKGTIISPAAIGFGAGATLQGRALAFGSGATTLSANVVTTS